MDYFTKELFFCKILNKRIGSHIIAMFYPNLSYNMVFYKALDEHMCESFQDYSWIQDFEAGFPQKVSLKMLNQGDYNRLSDLFLVCQKMVEHLNIKWVYFKF